MATEITITPHPHPPSKNQQKSSIFPAENAGFFKQNMAQTDSEKREQRPLSTRWMSDELIAYTQRVWSAYLGQPVTEAEAVEMLTNVRNVALAILTPNEEYGE